MPSGPKKRRAARNKKEKENININLSSTNNSIQGNDDLKSQNEEGSDGGEYNSHTSAARSIASEVMSVEKVCVDTKIEKVLGGKEDSVVMITRGLKAEDSYERENGRFQHIETVKESCYESGNGGRISNGESLAEKNSKDDECVILENSVAPLNEVIELAGKMNEDSVYPLTSKNAAASSLEEPRLKESNSKVLTSPSVTPKCSKNKPSVSSAPNSVQKTSWLSCCGMFEVLSGSNR